MHTLIFNSLFSFIISLFFCHFLIPLAHKIKLTDSPGGRKHHQGDIPLTGGLAMFLGFNFGLLTLNISLLPFRPLIAATSLLVIVGLLDDLHELSARARLFAQIIAAVMMMVWGHNTLFHLGNLLNIGNFQLHYLAYPLTIFATVGFINAINMLDGLDGLAGSQAVIAISILIFAALLHHNVQDFLLLSILIGAIIGFLFFNFPVFWRPQAQVFMGDAGSMFIGFILCWFAIRFTQHSDAILRPVTMLWIFMLPLVDTLRLMILRAWQKHSPFKPNRDHLHHLLLDQFKLSPTTTVLVLGCIALGAGIIGIVGELLHIPEWLMFLSYVLVFFIITYWSLHLKSN